MPIQFSCSCGKTLRAPDSMGGKQVKCPKCNSLLVVPTNDVVSAETVDPFALNSPSLAEASPNQVWQTSGTHNARSGFQDSKSAKKIPTWIPLAVIGFSFLGALIAIPTTIAIRARNNARAERTEADRIASNISRDNTTRVASQNGPTQSSWTTSGLAEAECKPVAELYVQSVMTGDIELMKQTLDIDEFLRRSTESVEMSDGFRKDLIKSMKASFLPKLMQGYTEAISSGSKCELLRVRNVNGELRGTIRISNDEWVPDYQELIFARNPNGEIKVVDNYLYSTGETHSETLKFGLIAIVATNDKTFLERMKGEGKAGKADVESLKKFQTSLQTSPAEALQAFDQLSPTLKRSKGIQVQRIQAAANVDDKTYLQAISDFRSMYPDDASGDILAISYHLVRNEVIEVIPCIERLDKALGGDPLLVDWIAKLRATEPKTPD